MGGPWAPHQQRAIDCIACSAEIPTQRVFYVAMPGGHLITTRRPRALPPRPPRFSSRRLAAALSRALAKFSRRSQQVTP